MVVVGTYGKFDNLWHCSSCGAYVLCKKGTWVPAGPMLTDELRHAHRAAHGAQDSLWRTSTVTREATHTWLLGMFGSPYVKDLTVAQCNKFVAIVETYLTNNHGGH